MTTMRKEVKIRGLTPDNSERYWSGTGWVDRTNITWPQSEADRMIRRINSEGDFCVWTEEV